MIAQGIHTQYKYKGQTQELQGISFRIGEDRFKGSQIDRQFSLGNLQKILAAQRKGQEVKPALSFEDRKKALLIRGNSQKPAAPAPQYSQGPSPLLLQLMTHIAASGDVPYEQTAGFVPKKKKKKKKGLGR